MPLTSMPERQRHAIVRTLTETKGRVGGDDGAAARLGLNRTTLLSRMKSWASIPNNFADLKPFDHSANSTCIVFTRLPIFLS